MRQLRMMFITMVLGLAALGAAPQADAQDITGQATALASTFTYQGYLTLSGSPVNGNCDFQFSLFDALSAGTQIGTTQTVTSIAVTNGVFNSQLNFGAAAFNGQDRYLQIAPRCPAGSGAYTPLTPRQAVTPAPYAMYAVGAPWTGLTGVPPGFADGNDNTGPDWSLTGNAGTLAGTNFLGTTDNVPLEIRVNGVRALLIQPAPESPNLIGGFSGNSVDAGVYGAVIGGGGGASTFTNLINSVTDIYGTVGGGGGNLAGNGDANVTNSHFATIGGGFQNIAGGPYTTVSGGSGNTARGYAATVGGGSGSTASNEGATVGGGEFNSASGAYATVPGGSLNTASGHFSFAAGYLAHAQHSGAFVWSCCLGGMNSRGTASFGNETFTARAAGGVRFYTTVTGTDTGVQLAAGGGAWASLSDRDAKANFSPVDPRAVLHSLMGVPITTWNYTTQDAAIRHIGPVAQDFYAAFGVGEDERHITTIDADGVALAAIQGLYQTVQDENAALRADNQTLREENAQQQVQIDDLNARLSRLEALAGVNTTDAGAFAPWLLFGLISTAGGAVALLRLRKGDQ